VFVVQIPVFLFHAADDKRIPPEHTGRFFFRNFGLHPATRRVLVASGGHYRAMIDQGIPKAIEWLSTLPKTVLPKHTIELPGVWTDVPPSPPEMARISPLSKRQAKTGRHLVLSRIRLPKLDLSTAAARHTFANAAKASLLRGVGGTLVKERIHAPGDQVLIDFVFRAKDSRTGQPETTIKRMVFIPGWSYALSVVTPTARYNELAQQNWASIDSFHVKATKN